MSLGNWYKNGWLRPHDTNDQQIQDLLNIADRDLADARTARLSSDWQFGIAYNAALKLCTILLYAEGYRPERLLAHYRTLQALPLILGNDRKDDDDKIWWTVVGFLFFSITVPAYWFMFGWPETIGRLNEQRAIEDPGGNREGTAGQPDP